ncbi:MAG: branched-chain amino acid ABC transporter permease [Chloroflexi bacterium]|nr:branched-chain amino acid ABC transporter permease [Chloroflexota bacterium]
MKKVETIGTLIVLAVFAIFPIVFPNPAITSTGVFTVIFATAVVAWNIFSGYTGYVSLGYAVYYGLGAYIFSLIMESGKIPLDYAPFLLLLPVGLLTAIIAIPIGWIVLRTRKHVFVVVTVATVFIMQLLAYNLRPITGGSAGIYLPAPSWSADFYNFPFYYVGLLVLILAVAVSWWIRHSKYGLCLIAIREDEDRALGLGVNTEAYKLSALVLSAFFAGTIGAMRAYFVGAIAPPDVFSPVFDIAVALMAFFGGVGTLLGPLLGAVVLEPLQQYLTLQFGAIGLDKILFGALLLAVILLLPEGVVTSLPKLWTKRVSAPQTATSPLPATGDQRALVVENSKQKQG